MLETAHVEEVCSYGHAQWADEANHAACFATAESAPEWMRDAGEGGPVAVYAYRAFPLLFDGSGATQPLTAEDLLGPEAPRPEVPRVHAYPVGRK
jgi:hypothetical protein